MLITMPDLDVSLRPASTGLVGYGVVLILAGVGSALLFALTLVYAAASQVFPDTALALTPRAAAPSLGLYGLSAVVLLWLGVGSIRHRRWARELIGVVAWLWLLSGLSGLLMLPFVWSPMVTMLADMGGLPPAWITAVLGGVTLFSAAVHVLLPGLMIAYYRRPNVAAACAARGPEQQWTDDLSAHALSMILLALLAAFTLALIPVYGFPMPLFGLLVTGWPRLALTAAGIVACLAIAWGTQKTSIAAWRWGMAASLFAGAASTVTFALVDVERMLLGLAMSAEEVKLLEAAAASISRTSAVVLSLVSWASLLGYQLWVRQAVTSRRRVDPHP